MSAWVIEHTDGRLLGAAGNRWVWVEPDDERVRLYDTAMDARGTIGLLPYGIKRHAVLRVLKRNAQNSITKGD